MASEVACDETDQRASVGCCQQHNILGTEVLVARGKELVRAGEVHPQLESVEEATTDNEFFGNDRAIALDQADGLISGNRIRDGEIGIFTFEGEDRLGAPTITDNDIEVSGWGIDLAPGTGGVVSGNTVCGGEVSIDVEADTDASVTGNEVCE